jgi:hypothetical protein
MSYLSPNWKALMVQIGTAPYVGSLAPEEEEHMFFSGSGLTRGKAIASVCG